MASTDASSRRQRSVYTPLRCVPLSYPRRAGVPIRWNCQLSQAMFWYEVALVCCARPPEPGVCASARFLCPRHHRPRALSSLSPARCKVLSTFSACNDKGSMCGDFIFMRAAGMPQRAASGRRQAGVWVAWWPWWLRRRCASGYGRNGFLIVSPSIRWPCCRSSLSRRGHPASRAAATMRAS